MISIDRIRHFQFLSAYDEPRGPLIYTVIVVLVLALVILVTSQID